MTKREAAEINVKTKGKIDNGAVICGECPFHSSDGDCSITDEDYPGCYEACKKWLKDTQDDEWTILNLKTPPDLTRKYKWQYRAQDFWWNTDLSNAAALSMVFDGKKLRYSEVIDYDGAYREAQETSPACNQSDDYEKHFFHAGYMFAKQEEKNVR